MERLDITQLPAHVREYIEALIAENQRLKEEIARLREQLAERRQAPPSRSPARERPSALPKPKYPETVMVITLSRHGRGKRTPINAYTPQHRGGVGVFDIKLPEDDAPAHLLVADVQSTLLCLTDQGRAFRVPVRVIPQGEIRENGALLKPHLTLLPDEQVTAVAVLDDATPWTHLFIITAQGWVKRLRSNYVGPRLNPGTVLVTPQREGGRPVVAFTGTETGDLLLVTRRGMGIRFPVTSAPGRGVRGILVQPDDEVVAATLVQEESTVLILSAQGQATRRPMRTFAANRSPGGKGKIAMRSEEVVAAAVADDTAEVFCISRFAKILRFPAGEVSVHQTPSRGVDVMNVRGDTITAMAVSHPPQLA